MVCCLVFFQMNLAQNRQLEFTVLPAFLLTLDRKSSVLVQPWSDGKILFLERSYNPEERHSAAETLAAFTHFTYEFSDKSLIMTAFEGKQE